MAASRKDVPTIDSSELKELTDKLITACHILDHEGVTDGYGHVRVRVPARRRLSPSPISVLARSRAIA